MERDPQGDPVRFRGHRPGGPPQHAASHQDVGPAPVNELQLAGCQHKKISKQSLCLV